MESLPLSLKINIWYFHVYIYDEGFYYTVEI